MNQETKNNEIREDELKNVNGSMDLGILPGFGTPNGEQQNNAMELNDDELNAAAGGCQDHDPNYYAATPPCVRCGYKYMLIGMPCPCCGASVEEQIGG